MRDPRRSIQPPFMEIEIDRAFEIGTSPSVELPGGLRARMKILRTNLDQLHKASVASQVPNVMKFAINALAKNYVEYFSTTEPGLESASMLTFGKARRDFEYYRKLYFTAVRGFRQLGGKLLTAPTPIPTPAQTSPDGVGSMLLLGGVVLVVGLVGYSMYGSRGD